MDVHEHDFWWKPGGTLECVCGASKRPLAKVVIEVPQAWVFEDVALFVVAPLLRPFPHLVELGSAALAEACLDLRFDADVLRSSAASTVWVDPAFVADQLWPDSAVSKIAVDGWVRLLRIELDDLESHDCDSCKECGCDGAKCCGCYDEACCQESHDSGNGSAH